MWFLGDFFTFVKPSGPAMALLLLCSIVTIAIVFERLFFFSSQYADAKTLLRRLGSRIAKNDISGAVSVCKQEKGMLPRILEFGLLRGKKSRADITDALNIGFMEYSQSLERNLGTIGTIAVVAPFVGLFGTVLGIIKAFQNIALKGNSSPAVVAVGVSEALITTAAGLFVAILSVIFFNYFKTCVKAYNREMIVACNQLAEMLHFHNVDETISTDFYEPVKTGHFDAVTCVR